MIYLPSRPEPAPYQILKHHTLTSPGVMKCLVTDTPRIFSTVRMFCAHWKARTGFKPHIAFKSQYQQLSPHFRNPFDCGVNMYEIPTGFNILQSGSDGEGLARIGTEYFQCSGRTGCAQPGDCNFKCSAFIYADDMAHTIISWQGAHGNIDVQGNTSWMDHLPIHPQVCHYISCLRKASRATPSTVYKQVHFILFIHEN